MEDNYQHRQDLVSPVPEFKGEPKEEQPKKYPGVGPKTREGNFNFKTNRQKANKFWFGCIGLPIGLRSMIHAENQPEWYKQMYNSLHQKQRRHNDYNNRMTRNESNFTNVY